jgi:hypothetical protein
MGAVCVGGGGGGGGAFEKCLSFDLKDIRCLLLFPLVTITPALCFVNFA